MALLYVGVAKTERDFRNRPWVRALGTGSGIEEQSGFLLLISNTAHLCHNDHICSVNINIFGSL